MICRDDLRKMLLGSYWTGRSVDEDRVTVAEEAQVRALVRAGIPVVIDATHLHPPFLRKWARLATQLGIPFEVVDVHADVDECKRNDYARMLAGGRYVGDKLIDRQARKYPEHKWPTVVATPFAVEPYAPDPTRPWGLLVDIDGTLAHYTDRSPFDYSRVSEDVVDPVIRNIVNEWRSDRDRGSFRRTVVMSGREGSCRKDTEAWLYRYGIRYDELFMREAKDYRPDYQVKYELFNKYVRDFYNVQFVLDDRDQVVEMWRKLGLKCLQVAEGNF